MALPKHLQQLPSCAILDEEVDILLVLEISIEGCHISMVEVELNAELTCDLIHIFFLSNLFLRHDFHTTQEACFFVLYKHDLSELAFTHLLANCEI